MPKGIYTRKPMSQETKEKISKAHIGKGNPFYGRKHSKETMKKLREIKLGSKNSFYGKKHSQESKDKMSQSSLADPPRGHKNGSWNGGINMDGGYVGIWHPSHPFANKRGYVKQHRLIAEECLGRYLEPTEEPHHINNIKTDNSPENLFVFENKSAHITFHLLLRNNPFLQDWLESNLLTI